MRPPAVLPPWLAQQLPQPQGLLGAIVCWQTNAFLTHVVIQEQVCLSTCPVTMLSLLRAKICHASPNLARAWLGVVCSKCLKDAAATMAR